MPLDATTLETLLEQVDAWKGRKQRHLVAEAEAGEKDAARQAATPDRAGGERPGGAAAEASTLAQQWEVGVTVPLSWRYIAGCCRAGALGRALATLGTTPWRNNGRSCHRMPGMLWAAIGYTQPLMCLLALGADTCC